MLLTLFVREATSPRGLVTMRDGFKWITNPPTHTSALSSFHHWDTILRERPPTNYWDPPWWFCMCFDDDDQVSKMYWARVKLAQEASWKTIFKITLQQPSSAALFADPLQLTSSKRAFNKRLQKASVTCLIKEPLQKSSSKSLFKILSSTSILEPPSKFVFKNPL